MTYWILAAAVTLSSFGLALAAAAALLPIFLPAVSRAAVRQTPGRRAALYLAARALPVLGALVFAILLVLPTFLYYEPRDTDEPLTFTMLAIAGGGLWLLGRGACRLIRSWRATVRLGRDWRSRGRRVTAIQSSIPVFAIDDPFPTVAVVGCLRPALFVSERVLRECTPDEVQAMVSHEHAHIGARDNFKRLLLRGCPPVPLAGRLDAAWAAAAEEAADAVAAGRNASRRLDLAHALVRIARLAPSSTLTAPVSAFYLGGTIDARVRLLLEPVEIAPPPTMGCVVAGLSFASFAALFVACAPAVHVAMEAIVRLVP